MLEVGKLYVCEKYHLLFYPDPDTATAAASTAAVATATTAALWSNRLGKPVFYTDKNTPILVLNNKEEYIEVLVGEKKGWIIYRDWFNLKEIDYGTS